MVHILQRNRSNGSIAFTAQIRKKEQGTTVYNITQTFKDRTKAKAWMSKVEADLKSGTRLPKLKEEKKTLIRVIDQYIEDLSDDIGKMDLSRFRAAPLIAFRATKKTAYGTETEAVNKTSKFLLERYVMRLAYELYRGRPHTFHAFHKLDHQRLCEKVRFRSPAHLRPLPEWNGIKVPIMSMYTSPHSVTGQRRAFTDVVVARYPGRSQSKL